jgi:predicted MFS family arabinose efflux permease
MFSSVNALGTALGTVVAGLLVDRVSPSAALALAVLPAVAALGVGLTTRPLTRTADSGRSGTSG